MAQRAFSERALHDVQAQVLAREFQEAKAGNAADGDLGLVLLDLFLKPAFHFPRMAAFPHVDEIDDNQPAEIAQTQLARNFDGRLQVDLENHLFEHPVAVGAPGIDIDGHQCFGSVDKQGAARFQGHPLAENLVDLVFQIELAGDRTLFLVELHCPLVSRADDAHEFLDRLENLPVVHQDGLDVGIEVIPQDLQGQILVFMNERGRGSAFHLLPDFFPDLHEVVEVFDNFFLGTVFGGGADDEADFFWHPEIVEDRAKPLPLGFFLDFSGNPALGLARHEDHVPAREGEIGGEERPFAADLFLDDLHQHFLAGMDHILDPHRLFNLILIVFRVNIRERQEPVAVHAIIDEGGLKARLDVGDNTFVKVTGDFAAGRRFDEKAFQRLPFDNSDPEFLRMHRIDDHRLICHCLTLLSFSREPGRLMLFRLIKEGAQRHFPVGLNGAIIGSVEVGNAHLMEQGFENGRTDGARHAGKGKHVHNAIAAVMGVFERSADAERGFGADGKGEQAIGLEPPFDLADTVIRLDIQVLEGAAINLVLTPRLVELFDFKVQPLPPGFPQGLAVFVLPGRKAAAAELAGPFEGNVIDPFTQRSVHHFPAEGFELPDDILIGIGMSAQIDFAHNPDARSARLPRIDEGASFGNDLFQKLQKLIEFQAGAADLNFGRHPLERLGHEGISHTRPPLVGTHPPDRPVQHVGNDHGHITQLAENRGALGSDNTVGGIGIFRGKIDNGDLTKVLEPVQNQPLEFVIHAESARTVGIRHEIDIAFGHEGRSQPLLFLLQVEEDVAEGHLAGETLLARREFPSLRQPSVGLQHDGVDSHRPKAGRNETAAEGSHIRDEKGSSGNIELLDAGLKTMKGMKIGRC